MIQANHSVEFMNKQEDRIRLVFDELPYQVNKAKLVMRIAELMKLKKLTVYPKLEMSLIEKEPD